MTTPLADTAAALAPAAAAARPAAADAARRLRRAVIVAAILLGATADALLHDGGPSGLAFPLWIALLGPRADGSLAWRADRPLPRRGGCLARRRRAVRRRARLAERRDAPCARRPRHARMPRPRRGLTARPRRRRSSLAGCATSFVAARRQLFEIARGIVPTRLSRREFGAETRTHRSAVAAALRARRRSRSSVRSSSCSAPCSAAPIRSSRASSRFRRSISARSSDASSSDRLLCVDGRRLGRVGALLDDLAARAVEPADSSSTKPTSPLRLGALNAPVRRVHRHAARLVLRRRGLSSRSHRAHASPTYARRGFFELVWVATLVVPLLVATPRRACDAGSRTFAAGTRVSLRVDHRAARRRVVSAVLRLKCTCTTTA